MEVPQYHPNLDHFSNFETNDDLRIPHFKRPLYMGKTSGFWKAWVCTNHCIPNDIHISPISSICLLASTAAPERPPGIFQHDRPPPNIEPWLVR